MDQVGRAEALRELHRAGEPLVLVNVWDPGSALAQATAGAPALATSSYAVARSRGLDDGEQVAVDDVVELIAAISRLAPLPLSVDIESGYGKDAHGVESTMKAIIEAGAVGCNIEDALPGAASLLSPDEQAARLAGARRAADRAGVPAVINARTDVFLRDAEAGEQGLEEVVARAADYAAAGADCLFVPGLTEPSMIRTLVDRSPLPVNVMVDFDADLVPLAACGVSRVSYGAAPYLAALGLVSSLASRVVTSAGR